MRKRSRRKFLPGRKGRSRTDKEVYVTHGDGAPMDAFPVAFASSSAGTGLAALNARSFFSLYDCGYSNRQMQRVAVRAVLIGCPEESSMPTSARGSSAVRKFLPGGA